VLTLFLECTGLNTRGDVDDKMAVYLVSRAVII